MSESTGLASRLSVTKHDGAIFMYNVGAVLSGAYLVSNFDIDESGAILAATVLLAVFWTLYFRFAMLRRFDDHPRFASDEAEKEGEEEAVEPMG
jgi:hypothetical protein